MEKDGGDEAGHFVALGGVGRIRREVMVVVQVAWVGMG